MSENHRTSIATINNLDWAAYTPGSIISVSTLMAREFAESLRAVMQTPSLAPFFKEVAAGELDTDNLRFEDYARRGDHWQFLWHFITASAEVTVEEVDVYDFDGYRETVSKMSAEARAMTIASRSHELPGIFAKILAAHAWDDMDFGFYRYYLKHHVELEGGDGGHGGLLKDFPCDDATLDTFWALHLNLYREFLILQD